MLTTAPLGVGLDEAEHGSAHGLHALLPAEEIGPLRLDVAPLARLHAFSVVGVDPVTMLTGPVPATQQVLDRAGLKLSDIGAFEINEAFATVLSVWQREIGADPALVNPNGGAIALGHPLGASGARLMTTLVHHMAATGAQFGLQSMCEGAGMANATILERL